MKKTIFSLNTFCNIQNTVLKKRLKKLKNDLELLKNIGEMSKNTIDIFLIFMNLLKLCK